MIEILPAQLPAEFEVARELIREYAIGLGVDLSFQGFQAELEALPGKYAPPRGRLLLAWRDGQALGCIAMRPLDRTSCEMKRLYVRPQGRGEQLGRRLAERVCAEARAAGYARICLDTLPTMAAAQSLYTSLGFVPIAPYTFNPFPDARFLALDL
ncbi:MAG: GNAT family N-acetyltransferase [Burkholderiaceae bacterium]